VVFLNNFFENVYFKTFSFSNRCVENTMRQKAKSSMSPQKERAQNIVHMIIKESRVPPLHCEAADFSDLSKAELMKELQKRDALVQQLKSEQEEVKATYKLKESEWDSILLKAKEEAKSHSYTFKVLSRRWKQKMVY